jgi:DNA processing protein
MDKESLYIHTFNLLPNFGLSRLYRIQQNFESFEHAFFATSGELTNAGIETEIVRAFQELKKSIDINLEKEKLETLGINLLTFQDSAFPSLLKEIAKPPLLLYYRGVMNDSEELCIAVVGTRKITNYGRVTTPHLTEPLIEHGAVIVSGLAYGVDSAVQQLAVQHGKRTVAVLGGGLDDKSFYPKEHVWLAQQIIDHGGALVSEYPPGTPPLKHHFIARNRIISGMSVATIVIECDLKSGSLITAKYALEQDRAVYAVPGPIYAEQSKGPNNLIKMGARLATDASDILNDLNINTAPLTSENRFLFGDSPVETTLLNMLTLEPLGINELIKQSGLDAGDVSSALIFLEMKGLVRNLGAQQYVRSR